jgi:hypothetical protein
LVDPFRNKIDMINETYIAVLSQLYLVFTDWGPEDDIKYMYGWAFVYILMTYCITNLLYTVINVFDNLVLFYKRFKNRYPRLFCKKKKQPSMKYLSGKSQYKRPTETN